MNLGTGEQPRQGTPKYMQLKMGISLKSACLTKCPFSPMGPTLRQHVNGVPIQAGLKIFFQRHEGEESFYFNPPNNLL